MKGAKFRKLLPVIIGLLLSIPLAIGAFFFLQNGTVTRANIAKPENVKVSKITMKSAVVTWTTDQETVGMVEYGPSPKEMGMVAPEVNPKSQHSVELTNLDSQTPYYFVISIGGETFDNEGIPWTFTTKGPNDTPAAEPTTKVVKQRNLKLPGEPTSAPVLGAETSCPATDDCEIIREKLGRGCSTSDFVKCTKRAAENGEVQGASTKANPTPTKVASQKHLRKSTDGEVTAAPQKKSPTPIKIPTYVPPENE